MTSTPPGSELSCVVLGAGGHARVLIEALHAGGVPVIGVLDQKVQVGTQVGGVLVLGQDEWLVGAGPSRPRAFVVGVGSVGDASIRRRLFELGRAHGLEPLIVRHPLAVVSPTAKLAAGCQLLAGCMVNTGAAIGENAIINSGAIVEHDCEIGAHAHVASGAVLGGGVRVGPGVHVGAGATVRQGIYIGPDAIVGAGAVVVKDVVTRTTVVGVPAKVIERKAS